MLDDYGALIDEGRVHVIDRDGVAHELNTPLSIVIGNTQMLEEELLESVAPELAERTGRVRAAAERCARIFDPFSRPSG
jgi:signal transduction histidine kinase